MENKSSKNDFEKKCMFPFVCIKYVYKLYTVLHCTTDCYIMYM